MAGINAEAEQREQLIAETEQRITDLKQQIEKVRDIDARMRKLRERRSSGRTSTDDRTDAGRTGSERPDDYGTEQAAKQIADLEREIEQRKQSREYRSIADKIKENRRTISQRDRQQEKSRRRSLTGYAGGIDKKLSLLELEHADMSYLFVPKKGTAL